jgi:hydrogenase expression/formation protein HypC
MCLAVPGRVDALEERDGTLMAEVDFGGVRKDVCCEYVPDIGLGDYVIVHVGFAIQRLDEASALATLAEFESMGILEEEFGDQVALAARQAGVEVPADAAPPTGPDAGQEGDGKP